MADRVSPPLPTVLEDRVAVAGGAVGTTLRSSEHQPDDVAGHAGRDEVSGVSGPDVVHAYLEAGADAVGTNTSGADLPNLADFGIEDRIFGPSGAGGGRPTSPPNTADRGWRSDRARRRGARLRDGRVEQAKGLLMDGVIGESPRSKHATEAGDQVVPLTARTTVMVLPGSEGLEPVVIDLIGLNCATGLADTGEHRRQSTDAFVAHHPEAEYSNV